MYFNKSKISIYLIIITIVLFVSCDDLFNSGDTTTKEYKLEDFSEIYIEDVFDVYLAQDTVCNLTLEGGSNLLSDIDFYIKDGQFHIKNENGSNWSRKYERIAVYISLKNITFLKVDESSNVQSIDTLRLPKITVWSITDYADISLTIKSNNFYIVNEGTSGGYFTIKGEAINSGMWARGSCIIDASELKTVNTNVQTESIGDCTVNASDKLKVEISRTGNVYYKGNPTLEFINEKAKNQLFKID